MIMTAKNMRLMLRLTVLAMTVLFVVDGVQAADPGFPFPSTSEMSDQKAGSLLVFNYYSSSPISALQENSRISITNTNQMEGATIHLYFIDGSTCSVADSWLCLPPNCTSTFSMAEVDPGTSGYLVAIASDGPVGFRSGGNTGKPVSFNHLIGDGFVTLSSGHRANLGAVAFAVVDGVDGMGNPIPVDPAYNGTSPTAQVVFDGTVGNYNRVPHVLAISSIPSPADSLNSSYDTQIIINRIGGTLLGQTDPLGDIFGNLYNDAGVSASLTFNTQSCQFKAGITRNFPRTVPRPNVHIPVGRTGWMRLFPPTTNVGILGAMLINDNNPSSSVPFTGGLNLHVMRLSANVSYTVPVFPPTC
jgi:hypothetical protein